MDRWLLKVGVSGSDGGIVLLEMSDMDFGPSLVVAKSAEARRKRVIIDELIK